MSMRCRGWGKDINRVRTERVVDLHRTDLSFCYYGDPSRGEKVRVEAKLTMTEEDELKVSRDETEDRIVFQGSLEDMKALREILDYGIRAHEENWAVRVPKDAATKVRG